jgi:hypothetical protein
MPQTVCSPWSSGSKPKDTALPHPPKPQSPGAKSSPSRGDAVPPAATTLPPMMKR